MMRMMITLIKMGSGEGKSENEFGDDDDDLLESDTSIPLATIPPSTHGHMHGHTVLLRSISNGSLLKSSGRHTAPQSHSPLVQRSLGVLGRTNMFPVAMGSIGDAPNMAEVWRWKRKAESGQKHFERECLLSLPQGHRAWANMQTERDSEEIESETTM